MSNDDIQTIAIVITFLITCWQLYLTREQWELTRKNLKIDNYSRMISSLNDLRHERIADTSVEKALFPARSVGKTEEEIKARIYVVMLANIFEWSLFSYESGLMDEENWTDWCTTWKTVILADKNSLVVELMTDPTVYTFSSKALKVIKDLL